MKIAFLSTYVPWPLDTGTRIRSYRMLHFLADRAEVHLILVGAASASDSAWTDQVKLASMRVFDIGRIWANRSDFLRAMAMQQLSFRPCRYHPGLRRQIASLLDGLAPQVLIANGTTSAQFLDLDRKLPGVRYLFDDAGTDHLRTARLLDAESRVRNRVGGRWDLWRLRRYERYISSRADGMLAAVPSEAAYLRRWRNNVTLVPCGANLDLFEFHRSEANNRILLFCGDLTYGPNEDAVAYFLEEIFPRIVARHPEAGFVAVGRYREGRLPSLAARFPQVQLVGYVEDMNPYWRQASIFVNPMRQGRGFITKILDALTAGLAVVSTEFLTGDLGIVPGRHFLGAADIEAFVAAVCALLESPERKRELAMEGRRFAEEHSWEAALQPLEQVVFAAQERGGR